MWVKSEEVKLEIKDSGSQDDLGDEGFQPHLTLSLDDVKIEVETSVETPANNSRGRVRQPSIPITYQNKNSSHAKVDMKQIEAEDQTSHAMSNPAIRRTCGSLHACSMSQLLVIVR